MTVIIPKEKNFYAFSSSLNPIYIVQKGEEFILETYDCFEGQIKKATDLTDQLDWNHINPATGPVYIQDVKPGDILRINILEVKVAKQSVITAVPNQGTLGNIIENSETKILERKGNILFFNNHLKIPINPMIGVIGVAPKFGSISNGIPDKHGGNLDCAKVCKGNKIYITSQIPGALFGCGDLHTVMGDGEIIATGAETAGSVRFRIDTVNLEGLPTPFLEDPEYVSTIASSPSIDEATYQATHAMADFLKMFVGISINEIGMLMSLVGNLRFCQVVDPNRTIRFEFPKWVLKEYGFTMPI